MDAGNALLVDHRSSWSATARDPLPADGRWAEPDSRACRATDARVFEDRDDARRLGERARRDIRAGHSPEAAAKSAERPRRVHPCCGPRAAGDRPSGSEHPRIVAGLPMRLAQGPTQRRRREGRRRARAAPRGGTAGDAALHRLSGRDVNAESWRRWPSSAATSLETRDHTAARVGRHPGRARREGAGTTGRDDGIEEIKRHPDARDRPQRVPGARADARTPRAHRPRAGRAARDTRSTAFELGSSPRTARTACWRRSCGASAPGAPFRRVRGRVRARGQLRLPRRCRGLARPVHGGGERCSVC